MDDVVAIKATDSRGKHHFFLTWGRVFDRTNPQSLLDAVRASLPQFGLSAVRRLETCATLQEACEQPYFFEALLSLAQQRVPTGRARTAWAANRRKKIAAGKDIYYLGRKVT